MTTAGMYLSESARAASASESRFRIDVPIAPARAARVVALDERAVGVARRLAGRPWAHARFYTPGEIREGEGLLHELDGATLPLDEVLTGTDVVVVLATEDGGRAAAAEIGRICRRRGITTAGVILGDGYEADDATAALRPYARVLLLSADEGDAFELLTALRV
ncbi:3-methyl-2-oxobutanoate hydroxymethyltransferase [Streptomyces tagetis]|uniref:3-methyl-2-oxobutanoate hydroxymethyltransferase n=1 Tax=Streptomyces tagetis TaxID=2820809 RepID=A0A941B1D0_9ACTN|nr:3-methyl-2-oxobutanoate hydroxymethyltransferase [Streptomyces sp. RG38]MBQ0826002.1 3-methyl-2-oxobutanoate hydroxymethyltransferase [Streptomyces sp. RG38]